jgi:hypothetical protein
VNVAFASRAILAVALCAALILLSAFSDDFVRPDYQWHHAETIKSPSGEVVGVSMYDTQPQRSVLEIVLIVAIPILALAGAGTYVAALAPRAKVRWGGAAASCGALASLVVIHMIEWRKPGDFPSITTALVWAILGFSVGAGAAWAAAKWWPNTSLERTREG